MPYIDDRKQVAFGQARRAYFFPVAISAVEPGDLNYQITLLCDRYLTARGGTSYTGLNDVLGVLSAISHEIYRRLAAPYEDRKIEENGDVFSPELLEVPK